MRKIFAALCFAILMCGVLPISVQATARSPHYGPIFIPFWENTAAITVDLYINRNGRATLTGTVIGNPGVEHISGTAVLERINANGTTTHVHTWNNIRGNGNVWMWEGFRYVARGQQYRFTLTAVVTRNGVNETVSLSRTAWAN
jgi:hypothetical protein